MKTAMKWGLYVGLANLVWLYLAYYLGLHTNGIVVFQFFMLGWLLLTVVGFVFALRAVRREKPTLTYLEGLLAGTVVAAITALVAVVMQIGYYKVVHPEWPEFMIAETRKHFTEQGLSEDEVEQKVAEAQATFTLQNYALASSVTALVTGIVISAILMIFLRPRAVPAREFRSA